MTTIAQLIGWDPLTQTAQDSTAVLESVKPDDYPLYAPDANALGTDIRSAYADALATKEHAEHIQDCAFLERASDFVQLHDQVEASTQLLDELSSFLSTFQRDLYAVSNHISDLQGRSKTIEARLEARKAVERSLHPFVAAITIPPSLISTITESEINATFIAAVYDLDARLGAIRGGARVESRRALDDVAEGLRVTAAAKILPHLVSLLKPYTVSITPSLPSLHTRLLALKPLFDFLRRHAARQAHEFQKAYVQTVRWYLETAFRRYVRALEKIRTSSTPQQQQSSEPIGIVNAGVDASLALLQQRRSAQQQSQARSRSQHPSDARSSATTVALDHARIDGPNVIQAHQANDRNFHPSPEELFRSCALVLASNAASEYAFISTFFGQHSTLEVGSTSSNSQFDGMRRRSSASASASASGLGSAIHERERSVDVDSDGGQTVGAARQPAAATPGLRRMASSVSGTTSLHSRAVQEEKVQRVVVDGLWKQVMEPALEYTRNFINALLDPVPPSTISLLAMVRLNDSLLTALASTTTAPDTDSLTPSHTPVSDNSDGGGGGGLPPCPALEPHLLAVRMQLLPILSKLMSAHVDSLRRINGSPAPSSSGGGGGGVGGMFARATGAVVGGAAGGGGSVKDSVVKVVIGRYAELFTAAVALWSNNEEPAALGGAADEDAEEAARRAKPVDGDDEMAFASLLRIRQEVDKLLAFQASKQADPAKRRAFMVAHCQELLHDLSAGHSSHPRTQAEVAHYRELARKAGP